MEINQFKDVFEFQKAYPSKPDREKALRNMTNEDIDKLVATCGTNQGKAYYASFKRTKQIQKRDGFFREDALERIYGE